MKIQLDTSNKIIKLEDSVLLSKLVETLDKLLPRGEWKKFTLETNTVIHNWSSPVVIDHYRPWREYPWYTLYNTADNINLCDNKALSMSKAELTSGTFNLDIK